jgi:hypothetical protein
MEWNPIKEPKIGYWWTNHCWCDLEQIKNKEDLDDCLEAIEEHIVEGVFTDLKDAEYHLDINGGDSESKTRFFERLNNK